MIRFGIVGVLFEVEAEPVADDAFHDALDLDVAQLALGLAFELRLGQLDADDGRQAFADIVAGQVRVVFLEELVLVGVVVQHAGQGGAEAGEVGAAVRVLTQLAKLKMVSVVAVVILEGDLDDGAV